MRVIVITCIFWTNVAEVWVLDLPVVTVCRVAPGVWQFILKNYDHNIHQVGVWDYFVWLKGPNWCVLLDKCGRNLGT